MNIMSQTLFIFITYPYYYTLFPHIVYRTDVTTKFTVLRLLPPSTNFFLLCVLKMFNIVKNKKILQHQTSSKSTTNHIENTIQVGRAFRHLTILAYSPHISTLICIYIFSIYYSALLLTDTNCEPI